MPYGGSQLPRHFPRKIDGIFQVFKFIHVYIVNILIMKKYDWIDHLDEFEIMLNKLKQNDPKFKIENYSFGQIEMEYLGLWVTCQGLQPIIS